MSLPSSSQSSRHGQGTSRRRLLATIGTGTFGSLGGCGTVLQGDPRSLNPAETVEGGPLSRAWEFPRGASDEQTPVQAYLDQAHAVSKDGSPSAIRFRFGATVFDYSKFHHHRIELRLQAVREGNTPPADIYVHPLAGGFTSFRTYVDDLETVIVLDDLEETGTLQFGFLVDAKTRPYPEALDYQFEITAADDDLFTPNAIASDSGRFPIVWEDG